VNPRVIPAGDAAFVVEFDEAIDPAVNARVMDLAATLRVARRPGVRDIVPTYRSVAVYFDPLKADVIALQDLLVREGATAAASAEAPRPAVRIPVCYGGDFGPDLDAVAGHAGLTGEEVVRIHTAGTYRVFMLGFLPGFAYLGVLDPRIGAPRLDAPRPSVPAGSVGIAGQQTGIYPTETPGGWRVIGRTPVKPYDAERASPFLLNPGDVVRFFPIDRREYEAWPA